MKEFSPDQFLFMGGIHTIYKMSSMDSNLTEEERQHWIHDAAASETLCHTLGLTHSQMAVERIKDFLSKNQQITWDDVERLTDQFDNRVIDELKSRKFFSIELDKSHLITDAPLFGQEVDTAFPSAAFDIREAGRCLAFERWTASVFHSMRVLEIGLSVLAKDAGIIKIDYKNWESLIQDIEANIKTASAGDKVKEQFYSEAALQFRYFKNAWRNHVMHVRDTYDEERANTIFGHVKEFMVHLTTRLKE